MVSLHGITEGDGMCFLVMEWAPLGPLDQYLADHRQRGGRGKAEGGQGDEMVLQSSNGTSTSTAGRETKGLGRESEAIELEAPRRLDSPPPLPSESL